LLHKRKTMQRADAFSIVFLFQDILVFGGRYCRGRWFGNGPLADAEK
jgi:hypothetical protein